MALLMMINGTLAMLLICLAAAHRWVCAARLSLTLLALSLLLAGVAVGSYVPQLPLVCTAWHSTLVPMSWANYRPSRNVEEGHVVSYTYQGRAYRALEIQVREFDVTARGCMPQLSASLLFGLLCILHISFCSRLASNARRTSSTDKLILRLLRSLHRFNFPVVSPSPPMATSSASGTAAAAQQPMWPRESVDQWVGDDWQRDGTPRPPEAPGVSHNSKVAEELRANGGPHSKAPLPAPVRRYIGMGGEDGPAECPVCISAYEVDERCAAGFEPQTLVAY